MEGGQETDLDELIPWTFALILDRGFGPQSIRDYCTSKIKNILSLNSFDDLVRDIPEDEANELRYDLKLLGFLDYENGDMM